MRLFTNILCRFKRRVAFVCLALLSLSSLASEINQKVVTQNGSPSLVLIKGVDLNEPIAFVDSKNDKRFVFPIKGSTSLLAWYFQGADELAKYDRVEWQKPNSEHAFEVSKSQVTLTELQRFGEVLKRISYQLERVGKLDPQSKNKAIATLRSEISELPESLRVELQTDLLIARLYLDSDFSKEAIEATSNSQSCAKGLSTFDDLCFELLDTRASAFAGRGQFRQARDIQRSMVKAFLPLSMEAWQRTSLTLIDAKSQLNNVHVAVHDSDVAEAQASIDKLTRIVQKDKLKNTFNGYQRGVIHMLLGSALMRSGNFDGAVIPFKIAEKEFKASNSLKHLPPVYSLLHSSHYVQGRYLQALDMITLAIEHVGKSSSSYHYFLLIQGNALAKLGRYHQAKASLTTAQTFYQSSQNRYYLAACYRALAVVERELGNYEEATRLHDAAIEYYWDAEKQAPSNLYSFLIAKSDSVITSIRRGDIARSNKDAAELAKSYEKVLVASESTKSLPEKSVLYALASHAAAVENRTSLVRYRDKLAKLLNQTAENSYLLDKARLEQLNLIEDLQQRDFLAAANHFQSLMSYVKKTRDEVRVVSFQRGYSNLVAKFAEPLIEALSLSLEKNWESDKADILLGVLGQIQGATLVEASRSARSRIAGGTYSTEKLSPQSLSKEIEVFSAQNQAENYALRAQADHSVLRENVLEALSQADSLESFDNQLENVASLIDRLNYDEIYLNSFDTKSHTFLLYLSKSRTGIIALGDLQNIDSLTHSANRLLVDRYSEPESALEKISRLFSLPRIFSDKAFRHAITTGNGRFSKVPFSTYRVNGQYVGAYIANTHINSTSYYFASKESFDIQKILVNDIAVIADPKFDRDSLMSVTRSGNDESFQNWISSLSPLPWTAKESQFIKSAFPEAQVTISVKENATNQNLRNLALTSSILHIATHGYFSFKTPELAGLALTETVDLNSGFLSVNQLSKIDLASRLVVFSACETAVSERSAGDGDWGLAQVALYAGARNAVGTLWKVPDRQTALFFESFYNSLSDGKSDMSTSLHTAKKEMISSKYSHPFYWAGFKAFATKRIDTYPFKF